MIVSEPLTFLVSIAPATGALKTMADGGFRVTLDIPETELPAYARLHLLRNTRLRIVLTVDDDGKTTDRTGYFSH